jgi:hypothetical protein
MTQECVGLFDSRIRIGDSRTPDRVARSAIVRSGVQHKASRAAAQYLFSKNWIPDRRGGFAAACPGYESADVIYAWHVIYGASLLLRQQTGVAAGGRRVDGHGLLGTETQQIMWPTGLGAGAGEAEAAERL